MTEKPTLKVLETTKKLVKDAAKIQGMHLNRYVDALLKAGMKLPKEVIREEAERWKDDD